ncbi:hypothetical protein EBU71_03275 [bacterium]|nr:hypothetical protein [Candidatus Elulimicrobium humile]
MAQWNKNQQDYLNQERTLFEVYMQADRYGEIFDPVGQGFNGDLFGRVKVSEPFTLFDSTHRYAQDGDFNDIVIGAGSTVGIITAQSTATLGIGTTAGCSIIRESKRVFSYQPGKALQVLQTFVFNPAQENLVQRAGYASSENGVMLELNGSQLSFIKRTAISGVGTTISVSQTDWNIDTLDGSGPNQSNPSGIALDMTKAQILFSEYEWLGVGCVRVGFANSFGKFHIAHVFNHANVLDSVYMTTATLPVRYEILNTGITTSTSTMKQICVSIQSNGGYEKRVASDVARQDSLVSVASTTFIPLTSIRLKAGREDAIVIPSQINCLPDSATSVYYEVALIKNATLTGGTWVTSSSPNVEQNVTATSMSGGTIVRTEYISSANKASTPLNEVTEYNWDLQLGRTQTKISDTYTLAVRAISGSGNAIGSLSFYDLT